MVLSRDYQWALFVGYISVAEGPGDATRSPIQLQRASILAQQNSAWDVDDSVRVAVDRP